MLEATEEIVEAFRLVGIRHTLPAQRGWQDNSSDWTTKMVGGTSDGVDTYYTSTAASAVTLCAADILNG